MYLSSFRPDQKQGRLLLDEAAVRSAVGCRQVFFPAVKDPANPILTAETPWEGDGPYTMQDLLAYLPDSGVYRMPYTTYRASPYSYGRGYAVSSDGLHWERPAWKDRRPEEFAMFFDETEGGSGRWCLPSAACSNLYDPRPECPPDERFKRMDFKVAGNRVWFSPDGVSGWHEYPGNPVWNGTSDMLQCLWDPNIRKFVCYFKLWKIWGEERDDSPAGSHPVTALAVTWNERKLDDGWIELYGDHFVTLHPESRAEVGWRSLILRDGDEADDDGGGGRLSGAWHTKRVVHRAVSDDFIHWSGEREVMDVDERDRPDANIQIVQVFLMGGYYLALLSLHDQRGHFDQQLAFSRDGIRWKRPWRGSLIGHGAPGEFDSGMASPAMAPIILGNQMILYYGGMSITHADSGTGSNAIGRAILRRDGFACWQAEDAPAQLETEVFRRTENGLWLNADAEGGRITAALLDRDDVPFPGCGHENCRPIIEDSATYPDCFLPVTWDGIKGLPPDERLRVQLRFRNARVYSILI